MLPSLQTKELMRNDICMAVLAVKASFQSHKNDVRQDRHALQCRVNLFMQASLNAGLRAAAASGRDAAVELLIKNRAEVNSEQDTFKRINVHGMTECDCVSFHFNSAQLDFELGRNVREDDGATALVLAGDSST